MLVWACRLCEPFLLISFCTFITKQAVARQNYEKTKRTKASFETVITSVNIKINRKLLPAWYRTKHRKKKQQRHKL